MNRSGRITKSYKRLGVEPEAVRTSPKVTPILRRFKDCRDEEGNPQDPIPFSIDCLRGSDSPDAKTFLSVYDSPDYPQSMRDDLPLEAFLVASGVEPARFISAIVGAAFQRSVQVGQVIAAIHHPKIVEMSAIMAATNPLAEADRGWQLKNMGFLPVPKGQATSINVNVQANANTQNVNIPLTAPEDRILRLSDRFNEARPLAPAVPVPELSAPVESEYLEDE